MMEIAAKRTAGLAADVESDILQQELSQAKQALEFASEETGDRRSKGIEDAQFYLASVQIHLDGDDAHECREIRQLVIGAQEGVTA